MPYGLFDYEDAMEPMGLSPQAPDFVPARTQIATNAQIAQYNQSIVDSKTPQYIPNNSSITTRAIPENPPAQSNPTTLAYRENEGMPSPVVTFGMGLAESSPSQQMAITKAYGENAQGQIPFTDASPEENPSNPSACNPMITRPAFGTSECGATPPLNVTMAIPESGVFPTPPSGQCPAGYQSSNQSSNQYLSTNNNPYGLTAGQQIVGSSTGKPFNVNQAGNTWQDITNFAPRIAYASR